MVGVLEAVLGIVLFCDCCRAHKSCRTKCKKRHRHVVRREVCCRSVGEKQRLSRVLSLVERCYFIAFCTLAKLRIQGLFLRHTSGNLAMALVASLGELKSPCTNENQPLPSLSVR